MSSAGAAMKERFAAAFPGVTLNWCRDRPYRPVNDIQISVSGSGNDLMIHGFLVAKIIELLPNCGVRYFSAFAQKKYGLPFSADVRRTTTGYRVERYYTDEEADRMRRVLGLPAELAGEALPKTAPHLRPVANSRRASRLRLVVDNTRQGVLL